MLLSLASNNMSCLVSTDLHYSLPVRYTTQILSQMAVKKCESLAFVSFTPESVSYIHADMDPGLDGNSAMKEQFFAYCSSCSSNGFAF
jgi:hypothetical protein